MPPAATRRGFAPAALPPRDGARARSSSAGAGDGDRRTAHVSALVCATPPTAASGQRFDASSVPLIDDEMRRSLASYPNRPDAKALAITGGGMGVAEGQPNAEAAKQDAVRQCSARTKRQCQLYAVGMDVVWSNEALPLPAPGDLRFEPLEIPLVPNEIPTIDRERQDMIARMHMNAPNHRALALDRARRLDRQRERDQGRSRRLALERCAEYWQRPCLSVGRWDADDADSEIASDQSACSCRRWRLNSRRRPERIGGDLSGRGMARLARGKNGSWHAVAGAASEEAAIETALKSCAQADQECRLYAIGNFRVLRRVIRPAHRE